MAGHSKNKTPSVLKPLLFFVLVSTILTILILSVRGERGKSSLTYSRLLMGTVVEFTFMDPDDGGLEDVAEHAFREIERLEGILSSYIPDSDVSKLSGRTEPTEVSPEVIDVLDVALRVAGLSGGAFDPTVGVLGKVWGFSAEREYVPAEDEVEGLLEYVDYRKIRIDREGSRVWFEKEGMVLNLGGVAKGYIVGRAVEILRKEGIKKGIVRAGGDLYVFNDRDGEPFSVGIQHPRRRGRLIGKITIHSGSVTTSGDYERFFTRDGRRYHHILDPSTGFPARGCQSVTIVADDPALADALSTAVFVLGAERGMRLVESLEGVEAVVVDSEGTVRVSEGLKERFTPIDG